MTSHRKPEDDDADNLPLALEEFLPYRLARAAEHVSRQFAVLYRKRHGMTRPEWRTLATIGQFHHITATEIGQHSSMHKTKVSRAIKTLEDRGWITRHVDQADRRVEHLELTRDGRANYMELVGIARRYEARLLATLGETDAAQLSAGISAIETHIVNS
ncbi:MarR family winged helix-turn-helix transcriptional regulator [Hoeflea olei]|uniref:MarR family transcriptional regulator n=1 Tax=Hoeflea olei TaxID=1480615 RepID=A0A1C1YW22_9HYPH|nr:MarR family winged helix-turn-helix transcriptional regulator [Hoeflea olei]OCW57754.1 MarR family transcriptional regulator [Hoeflea olei]